MVVRFALVLIFISTSSFAAPAIDEVRSAIVAARDIQALKRELRKLEGNDVRTSSIPKTCTFMMRSFHGRHSTSSSKETAMNAAIVAEATKLLLQRGFTHGDLHTTAVIDEFRRQLSACTTHADVTCDTAVTYRSEDGSCNNLVNTTWGMAGTPQLRILPAAYDSGSFSNPRSVGVNGNALPNPRTVSNEVHAPADPTAREIRSRKNTLHVFQMGQFLDHDIIATPIPSDAPDCCVSRDDVDNCLPIIVPDGDEFRPFRNNYCMDVARSTGVFCLESADPLVRQQVNAITSFIDASNVYGSSKEQTDELRDSTNTAFMAVEHTMDGDRLPNHPIQEVCRSNVALGHNCSLAGDFRVNVVPSLVSYHTLFVREHNRIAQTLSTFLSNPETIFQETRKILIALMQKLVYEEFLPTFMSRAAMDKYGLGRDNSYAYNADVNPSVSSGFGLAYRAGHSWIPKNMDVFDRQLQLSVMTRTQETYFDPALTYISGDPNGLEGLAYWMTAVNSPETDRIVENAARNRLFEDENRDSFDLAALNINRGRDHGVPSYTAYRSWCELSDITAWSTSVEDNGFTDHTADLVARLHRVYESPADIDLFTGALTETHSDGAGIGPTLECILGDQFSRLKYGDRFWYEGEAANFTSAQLTAIQTHSMSRILCDNYDFARLNRNAFDATTERVRCDTVSSMDLSVFDPSAAPTPPPTPPPPPPPGDGGGGDGGGGDGGGGDGGRKPRPPRLLDDLIERVLQELENEST